jgi:hypothetical protein
MKKRHWKDLKLCAESDFIFTEYLKDSTFAMNSGSLCQFPSPKDYQFERFEDKDWYKK